MSANFWTNLINANLPLPTNTPTQTDQNILKYSSPVNTNAALQSTQAAYKASQTQTKTAWYVKYGLDILAVLIGLIFLTIGLIMIFKVDIEKTATTVAKMGA